MEKKPEPYFFCSKNFDKSLLEEEPIKQAKGKDDKTMSETAKAQKGKSRNRLTGEQVAKMIKEWDDKSVSEWAKEFGVSYQTVSKMAEVAREHDASLCPKKPAIKVKRQDILKLAIDILKKDKGKK